MMLSLLLLPPLIYDDNDDDDDDGTYFFNQSIISGINISITRIPLLLLQLLCIH